MRPWWFLKIFVLCLKMDVMKTAFLIGDIKEEVYVIQPEGFVKKGVRTLSVYIV